MEKTPKSLRVQIGLFGRTNVGKSSFLNYVAGQEVAIASPVPGTTTDVVEKAMELLPVGPVLFLDTAGLDDTSELSALRLEKTQKIFQRADIAILVTEAVGWSGYEEAVLVECQRLNMPCLVVINKMDQEAPGPELLEQLKKRGMDPIQCSCVNRLDRERVVVEFKAKLLKAAGDGVLHAPALISDLVPPQGLAVLVVPIDLEAPKGRLILPQVQAIRDLLDGNAAALVVKERQYRQALSQLKNPPDLVVCDSQAVREVMADTPLNVPCTTFSILFARLKGDLRQMVHGVRAVDRLKDGDRVLVGEACTHHAVEDDIGRVKIPRWLKQHTGLSLQIDTVAGFDYPKDLSDYRLVIHCGGCMLNRRLMLSRLQTARDANVAITNYGVLISYLLGVLDRALKPFPALLEEWTHVRQLELKAGAL